MLLPIVLLAFAATPTKPTDLERQRLISHLEMTESWLADEVSGLSPAQLAFRPSPKAWNALDCVEHLVLAENEYWTMYRKVMAGPASRKESPSEDVDRLWYGIDRTERTTTVPSETPKSTYADAATALADFRKLRATIREYTKTTQEDWRHHLVPEWDRDGYQWLVMISAHAQRHILQVREIKHSAGFPGR
jgi:hypothetical protein